MHEFSTLKSRRFSAHPVERTCQLVVFSLHQEWFALLIQVVQKVLPMGNAYGDVTGTGISLTLYQNRELVVVDIGRRLFGSALSSELLAQYALPPATESEAVAHASALCKLSTSNTIKQEQATDIESYMLIVKTSLGELVGLPINSPPTLRRVAESAFSPIPPAYLSHVPIQCVSSAVVQSRDEPPLFLIDPDQLI